MRAYLVAAFLTIICTAGCSPPNLDPAPPTLDFGPVYVGTGAPRPANWNNSGGSAANVGQIVISGTDAARFTAVPFAPPPARIPRHGTLTPPATLVFVPNAPGPFAAIATPAVAEAKAVVNTMALQGEGVTQLARGDLTVGGQPIRVGQSVTFGRVAVGQTSPVITFDLVNPIGAQGITVMKIEFSPNTQSFTVIAPAVPFRVPANGRTAVQITFTPPQFPNPPQEKMFRDGVTFFEAQTDSLGKITKSAAGVALCGVGFYPSDNPPFPPMRCL